MSLRKFFVAITLISFGQPTLASPQEDITSIASYLVTESLIEPMKVQIALAYTDVYAAFLQERSIFVLDRGQFANLLSDQVTGDAIILLRRLVTETCFRNLTADQISAAADEVRHIMSGQRPEPGNMVLSFPQQDLAISQQSLNIGVDFCSISLTLRLDSEIRQVGEIPSVAYLPDILEIDGIASFPNRIVRRNTISEFRYQDQ
jgi:hypothetical protein